MFKLLFLNLLKSLKVIFIKVFDLYFIKNLISF